MTQKAPHRPPRRGVAPKEEGEAAKKKRAHEKESEELDREIESTFPASDPPSMTQPGGPHDPHSFRRPAQQRSPPRPPKPGG